jgi:hypothetical protein
MNDNLPSGKKPFRMLVHFACECKPPPPPRTPYRTLQWNASPKELLAGAENQWSVLTTFGDEPNVSCAFARVLVCATSCS